MTGPEHYSEAEKLIAQVKDKELPVSVVAVYAATAQVHATLALTAVCWTGLSHGYDIYKQWEKVIDPGRYDEVTP